MDFLQKTRIISTVFLVVFILIFLRLVYIQVFRHDSFVVDAERQHFASLLVPARRGEILTSDNFPLASDKNTYLLYANLPKISDDKRIIAQKLAPILSENIPLIATNSSREQITKDLEATLSAKLSAPNAIWLNLAHFLGKDYKTKIESLNISGLGFTDEEARDYPESSMAAHLLGIVGFDNVGNPQGYFGLEGYYNRELAGKPGEIRVEKDAFGRPIAIGEEIRKNQQDGRNLITTINRAAQKFTESALADGIETWKATGGSAIVMDPNDGAIIAMASFPKYDPESYTYYPDSLYQNPAVADLYEPGSIFKPLVMAAALNEGAVTPKTRCDKCDGPRLVGDSYIHTFDNQYHPNLTMTEVLVNSDNTGMVFTMEQLGFEKLYDYVKKYGFGQKSGIDLQEEQGGNLRLAEDYYPVDKATFSFGQGIGVNAIQVMRGWATLANGGYLITPHLVSKISSTDREIPLSWPKGSQVLKTDTTRVIGEMLVRVANESPEHFPKDRISELANFKISAKSGTAQIALGGKYKDKGTTASVIGYFPTDSPRFLVMVKLNEPEVRIWGSDTAGPIFFDIVKNLILYYNLNP